MMNITAPGKFEGCPAWVPEVWNDVLEGFADHEVQPDDGDGPIALFHLDHDMAMKTGLNSGPHLWLGLWETTDGFVIWDILTDMEVDKFEREGQSNA